MSRQELHIAIIGAGTIARYHAQAIALTPGARLMAVCRSDGGDAAAVEREFGVPCAAGVEALLSMDDVDAVCVCSPSGLHAGHAIAAANAGKHVLVEKPMALTTADADAMIEACRAAGVRLGVVLQRRADPAFQAVHAAVAAGELGRPVLGTISVPYVREEAYYNSAAWRGTWAMDGGGALINQGIHLVDLLLWYLGNAVEVQARAATLAHDIEVEDTLAALLRFDGGALGSIVATTAAAPGYPHRVEIYGDRGGVQIEGERVVRWALPGRTSGSAAGLEAAGAGSSPTGIAVDNHARIVADFVAAVRDGREPMVTGADGRRSLDLVRRIYAAAGVGS